MTTAIFPLSLSKFLITYFFTTASAKFVLAASLLGSCPSATYRRLKIGVHAFPNMERLNLVGGVMVDQNHHVGHEATESVLALLTSNSLHRVLLRQDYRLAKLFLRRGHSNANHPRRRRHNCG